MRRAAFLFVAVVAGMFALALGWNYLKRERQVVCRIAQIGAAGAFLFLFFTRDF